MTDGSYTAANSLKFLILQEFQGYMNGVYFSCPLFSSNISFGVKSCWKGGWKISNSVREKTNLVLLIRHESTRPTGKARSAGAAERKWVENSGRK